MRLRIPLFLLTIATFLSTSLSRLRRYQVKGPTAISIAFCNAFPKIISF